MDASAASTPAEPAAPAPELEPEPEPEQQEQEQAMQVVELSPTVEASSTDAVGASREAQAARAERLESDSPKPARELAAAATALS